MNLSNLRINASVFALDKIEPQISMDNMDSQRIDLSRELPSLDGINVVYHLAANPEVRIGSSDVETIQKEESPNVHRFLPLAESHIRTRSGWTPPDRLNLAY